MQEKFENDYFAHWNTNEIFFPKNIYVSHEIAIMHQISLNLCIGPKSCKNHSENLLLLG